MDGPWPAIDVAARAGAGTAELSWLTFRHGVEVSRFPEGRALLCQSDQLDCDPRSPSALVGITSGVA